MSAGKPKKRRLNAPRQMSGCGRTLGSVSPGFLGDQAKDGSQPLYPGAQAVRRMVPAEPPPAGQGAAPNHRRETEGSLSVLRDHRELDSDLAFSFRDGSSVAPMAQSPLAAGSDALGPFLSVPGALRPASCEVRPLVPRHAANHGPRSRMREIRSSGSVRGEGEQSPFPTSMTPSHGTPSSYRTGTTSRTSLTVVRV